MLRHWFLIVVYLGFQGIAGADSKTAGVMQKLREDCQQLLIETYKSENSFVRAAVMRAAGESHDPDLVPLLEKGIHDYYPTARLFALQGLKEVSSSAALAAARELTDDSDIWVRSAAVEMLGDEGGSGAKEEIRGYLKSFDVPMKLAASAGLVKLGENEYMEEVLDPLTHPIPDRRYQAIGYLGKIGGEKVLPHLVKLFDHAEPEMVYYSLKALEGKATLEMLPRLRELAKHSNASIRQATAMAMGNIKNAEEDLIPLCADEDGLTKLSAAVALNQIGSDSCQVVFEELLSHEDFKVRSSMARVLGKTPIPQRLKILTAVLKDSHSRVRIAAVRGVGMIGGPEAFPLLVRMLEDPKEAIRAYAAGNLIRLLN
ncbi:MAG: HEAT repeat domain-containing protein [Nitrospinota bacterium]